MDFWRRSDGHFSGELRACFLKMGMEGSFHNLTVGTEISKAEVTGVLRTHLPWPELSLGSPPLPAPPGAGLLAPDSGVALLVASTVRAWAAESPVGLIKHPGHV